MYPGSADRKIIIQTDALITSWPMRHFIPILIAIGFATSTLQAQSRSLSPKDRIDGERTTAAFAKAVDDQKRSTARILRDGDLVALATVVSKDGLLVTKASELEGSISVELTDGRHFDSPLTAVDLEEDIALLKIPVEDLEPIRWTESKALQLGHWVAGFGSRSNTLRIGIISAKRRAIERIGVGGALGVTLGEDGVGVGGVFIARVVPKSAAQTAGIKQSDIVTSVEGETVMSREELIKSISSHDPGEKITVTINREDEEMKIQVTLDAREVMLDSLDHDLEFSGGTSKRRSGFSEVIQHDASLSPRAMGGPLLSLDGEAYGINIARADRVATYALPSELVRSAIKRLKKRLSAEEK